MGFFFKSFPNRFTNKQNTITRQHIQNGKASTKNILQIFCIKLKKKKCIFFFLSILLYFNIIKKCRGDKAYIIYYRSNLNNCITFYVTIPSCKDLALPGGYLGLDHHLLPNLAKTELLVFLQLPTFNNFSVQLGSSTTNYPM